MGIRRGEKSVIGKTVFTNLHGREAEVFFVLLLSSGKYSFLPELYEIFGRENTIKFLEIFAGTSFEVPTVSQIERMARNTKIYTRLKMATSPHRSGVRKALADEFLITVQKVQELFDSTANLLEESLGFKLTRKAKV